MQAPQRGPRRFRALAVLAIASAALLFLPSLGQSAGGRHGITAGLLESIHDLTGVLEQAARHGDRKEVRAIDHALEDMLRALEHELKHHQKQQAHHKGGAIHKGMQVGGKDRQPFASLPSATDQGKDAVVKGKGQGNFGHGIGQVGRWQDEGRDDKNSRFGSGAHVAFKHGHEACDDNVPTSLSSKSKSTDNGSTKSSNTAVLQGMQGVTPTTDASTLTAGNSVGGKKSKNSNATPTAVTTKATKGSTGIGTTAASAKATPGMAAASSKTVGTNSVASGTAKPAAKDHCAAEIKQHEQHTAAKSTAAKAVASAVAGHKQVANVGKLPSTVTHAAPAAKKAAAPTQVANNFANSGRSVGGTVGQHRPIAQTKTSVGKKK